jgi:rhodanese-related sulfurtransferase
MPAREVSPGELARALKGPENERPVILDVRNPDEVRFASLPGSLNVPMQELPARLDEVRDIADRPVVVLCHHGVRSYHAAVWLESVGIAASSLRGGIEGWAIEVDPKMPRY